MVVMTLSDDEVFRVFGQEYMKGLMLRQLPLQQWFKEYTGFTVQARVDPDTRAVDWDIEFPSDAECVEFKLKWL